MAFLLAAGRFTGFDGPDGGAGADGPPPGAAATVELDSPVFGGRRCPPPALRLEDKDGAWVDLGSDEAGWNPGAVDKGRCWGVSDMSCRVC